MASNNTQAANGEPGQDRRPGGFYRVPNYLHLEQMKRVGPGPWCLLTDLIRRAGRDGYVFPSVKAIKKDTGLGVTTVHRGLRILEAAGLIKRELETTTRGVRNRYHLLFMADGVLPNRKDGVLPNPVRGTSESEIGVLRNPKDPTEETISIEQDPNEKDSLTKKAEREFSIFYDRYPNKTKKPAALVEWKKAIALGFDPADIVAGLKAHIASGKWQTEPDFIPGPDSFLRNHQWLDKPKPAKKGGQHGRTNRGDDFDFDARQANKDRDDG